MATSIKRLWLLVALLGFASVAFAQPNAAGPRRLPPTRSSFSVKIGGVEYLPVSELERRGGLQASWLKKDERVLLKNARCQIELQADSRETKINGMRVFLGDSVRIHRRALMISRVDLEVALLPLARPEAIAGSAPEMKIIALDAGHGGADNGTGNQRLGLKEKVFTLDVTLRLKKVLEVAGYKVVLTRSNDSYLPLALRTEIANRAGADLFVSIHFNSLFPDTKTSGMEIYTFTPKFQRSTNSSGAKKDDTENVASQVNRFDAWSSVLAHAIHKELRSTLGSFDRGKKIAHYGVLRRLNCPGVLIESAFLSNEVEARKVKTSLYRQRTAEAIARGIRVYGAAVGSVRKK